ncbi:MAG: two-component regulator propeller domain-containing protein, partial [Bacteroidota bacterium]|nr:two-component regulator propeller domain-containing protein [Bacteroidota bacterium]
NFWVGTSDGYLNKFDRAKDNFVRINIAGLIQAPTIAEENYYDYPIVFSRNTVGAITFITEDNYGNLWLGTWGRGVIIYNQATKKVTAYQHQINTNGGLSYNRVSRILIDGSTVWIATLGGGLNRIVNYKGNCSNLHFEHFLPISDKSFSITGKRVMALYKDRAGNIWAGCYDGGLNRINKNNKDFSLDKVKFLNLKNGYFNSINGKSIMSILEDNEGYIWAGTFGSGLYRVDPNSGAAVNFKSIPGDSKTLADNDILSLYQDRGNIIWAGTHLGEGLNKIQRKKNKFYLLKDILPFSKQPVDDVVWAVFDDGEGKIYVGTYRSGIQIYDEKKKTLSSIKAGSGQRNLSDNHIRSFAKDNYGNLWVGTYNGGLNKINLKTGIIDKYLHNPLDKNSIGGNQILSIYIDKKNTVWIASFGGGLNSFSLNNSDRKIVFKKYLNNPSDQKSLSDNRVYSILEAKDGTFWVGTFGGGLNRLNKDGTFSRFSNNPSNSRSLGSDKVISIFEDSKNNLWVGTYGGGLNRLDKNTGSFYRYSPSNLLESDVIYGILEDEKRNIWVSTNNGIYKLNIITNTVLHFDIKDGLLSREFSGGAYFKSISGRMYFGGIKGVNYFSPNEIVINTHIPQIVISSIKVFGKPVQGEKDIITLNYNENYLNIEFAALDYSNPNDNRYMYKLEGLDNNWQTSPASIRTAIYTNLSPGEYVFRVIGSNNDEVWNKNGISIKIIILTPFYQKWWFILTVFLLLSGLAGSAYTIRVKNMLAIEKLKAKLSADLHDSIGSGLTEISILSELTAAQVNNSSYDASGNLNTISEKARYLIDNMSDIVWVVNPKRDSLNDLILRLKDYYADLLSAMNISFKTNYSEDIEEFKLSMEYKQNLYLLLKEAINNAIKHSECKRITLDVLNDGKYLEILLSDDGKGYDTKELSLGNGLINIEKRAKIIGAQVVISSEMGKGTKILFKGRIGNVSKFKALLKKP